MDGHSRPGHMSVCADVRGLDYKPGEPMEPSSGEGPGGG